jgi:hypothetical protein
MQYSAEHKVRVCSVAIFLPIGNMERESTLRFLLNLNPELAKYDQLLTNIGFTLTASLKFLQMDDLSAISNVAHKRMLLEAVHYLPDVCKEYAIRKQLIPGVKRRTGSGTQRKLPFTTDDVSSELGNETDDDSKPVDFYNYQSPMEKELEQMKLQLTTKESEILLTKNKLDTLMDNYPSPDTDISLGRNICSNCHLRGKIFPKIYISNQLYSYINLIVVRCSIYNLRTL